MKSTIQSHKDLIVWQRAMDLTLSVYELTHLFPSDERYGLISQMRRAAVSIASNIAEGRSRGSRNEFRQFLHIAYASGNELETQILIAKQLPYTQRLDYQKADDQLKQTMKMLNAMLFKMRKQKEKLTS